MSLCRFVVTAAVFFCLYTGLVSTTVAQVGAIATDSGASGTSTDPEIVRSRFLEYERQLNAMLETKRDEEERFVAEVVNQIRLGKIPSKLVTTSFEWVRNKRPDTEYPFVYFERVLRLQARRLKIGDEIPKFDYRIYSQPQDPTARSEVAGNEAITMDNTATERNGGFDFFRRAFTRVVPSAITGRESPNSDNAETERNNGGGFFRLGGLLRGLRR